MLVFFPIVMAAISCHYKVLQFQSLARTKSTFCTQKIPTMVTHINDRQINHMASGGEFNIALDSDGHTWGWGKNDLGQVSSK